MIDLHTHIIPGVDDGVETEDEAVEFARVAANDGVEMIVATPHCKEEIWPNDRESVLAAVGRLRERFERESVAIELVPGAEVHIGPDLVERVRDGRAPTLDDNGKTLLLELSLSQPPPVQLEKLIFELKLAGLEVVLAHPERIRYFEEAPARYEAVVRVGAYGQITTGSILGTFGSRIEEYSRQLLRQGLVHVLASDAHNLRGRPPVLSSALEVAVPFVGERYAKGMVDSVPRALLEGRVPEIPPVESPARSRATFFSKIFRRG